jgi:integrase/recombinase XerD
MTPDDLMALWGYHAGAAGLSPLTVKARRGAVLRAASLAGVDTTGLQQMDVVRFLSRDHLSPWSKRIYFVHLRAWGDFLVTQGARADNPTDGLTTPRAPRQYPRPMSDAQLSQALAAAHPRTFAYLTLAAYAGLRACEVAAVLGEDVGEFIVIGGKGNTVALVPTHPKVAALAATHPREGFWFPGVDHGHVSAKAVSQTTTKLMKKIGIGASLHQARHWYGTNVLRTSGGNLRVAQELLRHASIATTAGYTFITSIERSDAIAALPDVERPREVVDMVPLRLVDPMGA